MTATILNKGDLVRLRSGGPGMTVEQIFAAIPCPYAHCAWFDDKGFPRRANFVVEALAQLPEPQTEPD